MMHIPSKDEILAWIADHPTLTSKRDIARAFGIKGSDRIGLKANSRPRDISRSAAAPTATRNACRRSA
jgi:hypothetical protein